MAAPRRSTLGIILVCLATLALTEYVVITYLVQPLPSKRFDWLVATLCIAPFATAFFLWLAMLTARVIADVLAFLRYIGQWTTKEHRHHQNVDATPSPNTPSAAYPSSSSGWPSAGPSYTSHPGREQRHEPRRTRTQAP